MQTQCQKCVHTAIYKKFIWLDPTGRFSARGPGLHIGVLADGFSPAAEFIVAGSAMSQNGRLRMLLKPGPLKMPGTPTKKEAGKTGPGYVWLPEQDLNLQHSG
jgi:hypothetical protein